MGHESISYPQEGQEQGGQMGFNFETGAPPAYETPEIIPRALCYDGKYSNRDLRAGEKPGEWFDSEGNLWVKDEKRTDEFRLESSAEYLEVLKGVRERNPDWRDSPLEARARMIISTRRFNENKARKEAEKIAARKEGKEKNKK